MKIAYGGLMRLVQVTAVARGRRDHPGDRGARNLSVESRVGCVQSLDVVAGG
jgi:hypothetical protein